VDRDGHTVWLAVVDGRQAHSRGLSLAALARMLRGLGATEVINLDGGGSAALYLATRKGLVSSPADRTEREVLNHVGVFWRPTRLQLATYRANQALLRALSRLPATDRRPPAARRAARASAAGSRPRSAAAGDPAPDRTQPAATPAATPAALERPPEPSSAGVPSGWQRWLQRHWREVLSPRNLLVGIPALLTVVLLGTWLVRRCRRQGSCSE
jgi:hypothetical protein